MWRPAQRSRERRVAALGRQLADESESFLDGSYPSVLESKGLAVPEWAWVSVLAHSPIETVAACAAGAGRRDAVDRTDALWRGALSLLAQELIATAHTTGTTVEELQHRLVTDVELGDRQLDGDGLLVGPSRMVEEVRRALDRHRDSHRR